MPFCPKCSVEYLAGFQTCNDCNVELVETLEGITKKEEEKNIKLVTIQTFDKSVYAHIIKAKLESEGIECFLIDENIVTMNWFLSNAVGGIKLQVKNSDVEKALEIIKNNQEDNVEDC